MKALYESILDIDSIKQNAKSLEKKVEYLIKIEEILNNALFDNSDLSLKSIYDYQRGDCISFIFNFKNGKTYDDGEKLKKLIHKQIKALREFNIKTRTIWRGTNSFFTIYFIDFENDNPQRNLMDYKYPFIQFKTMFNVDSINKSLKHITVEINKMFIPNICKAFK